MNNQQDVQTCICPSTMFSRNGLCRFDEDHLRSTRFSIHRERLLLALPCCASAFYFSHSHNHGATVLGKCRCCTTTQDQPFPFSSERCTRCSHTLGWKQIVPPLCYTTISILLGFMQMSNLAHPNATSTFSYSSPRREIYPKMGSNFIPMRVIVIVG